jgi:uncharacterized membrane protein YecN with MAPEG domain
MLTLIPVTLATAGILGLIYVVLSARVVMARRDTKVEIGDGGGKPETAGLQVRVRSHANFAEYVPIALLLLGGCELAGGAHWLMVFLAIMLIAGRILHPLGMSKPAPNGYRAGGAMLTWVMIVIASLEALKLAL